MIGAPRQGGKTLSAVLKNPSKFSTSDLGGVSNHGLHRLIGVFSPLSLPGGFNIVAHAALLTQTSSAPAEHFFFSDIGRK